MKPIALVKTGNAVRAVLITEASIGKNGVKMGGMVGGRSWRHVNLSRYARANRLPAPMV